MNLPVLTFSGLLQQMAAGLQGSAGPLIDLTIGSVLRAVLEACASVTLWLQWLILQVLATTRAATSNGPDLDSWMADFSFVRLPGASSSGTVTFSRHTPGVSATIPVGTELMTADGTQTFVVTEDDGNSAWNPPGGYVLPAPQTAVTVPVSCTQLGPGGNVQAGTIALLQSPIIGVDTVINLLPLGGGASAESDNDFRSRFLLFINSRSLATEAAIRDAIASVQVGLRSAVIENVDPQFNVVPGSFLVIVDDGSGYPAGIILANVEAAVNLVRPIGSTFAVQGPVVVNAAVFMTIETTNALTHVAIATGIQQAVTAWIQSLPLAATLSISKLDAIAHAFDSTVLSVTTTLINGSATDLVAPVNGAIVPVSVTVS